MANCRDIGARAMRKIGVLAAGREARSVDAEDALEALKGLYKSLIEQGAFGRLADVVPTTDYTAGENQRIFRNSEAVTAITLPELVPSYSTPLPYNQEVDNYAVNYEGTDGNNRPPRDGSVVVVADAFAQTVLYYIYDGTIRQWQEVGGLGLTDTAPRSASDPEGLAACLAMEIADSYGVSVGPATQMQAQRFGMAIASGFSRPREQAVGVYC